jgi:hypothetical protein
MVRRTLKETAQHSLTAVRSGSIVIIMLRLAEPRR